MKIAMIVESAPGVFSGGRVHAWLVACGLREIGHEVDVITQRPPLWWESLRRHYTMPGIKLTHRLETWRKPGYDLVWGYPILASSWALNFAREIGVPCWNTVLDAWPIISRWAPAIASRMHFTDGHTKALHDSDLLLTISEFAVPVVKKWVGNQNVRCLMVCVNSRCADSVRAKKTRRFVAITRSTEHKRFSDLLQVAKKTGIGLDIITSFQPDRMLKEIDRSGLRNVVCVYPSPGEEKKFEIIKGAVAGIGASAYEGLGMPFMEYLYCGLPVACYKFPILEEVCGDAALYASHSSPESLTKQAAKLMDDYTGQDLEIAAYAIGKKYKFESMCGRLEELFDKAM